LENDPVNLDIHAAVHKSVAARAAPMVEIDANSRSVLHTFQWHEFGFIGFQSGFTEQTILQCRLSFRDQAVSLPLSLWLRLPSGRIDPIILENSGSLPAGPIHIKCKENRHYRNIEPGEWPFGRVLTLYSLGYRLSIP
jgi:hypothetical protein